MPLLILLAIAQANVYFRTDDIYQRLKDRIDAASTSIDICYYNLDSTFITDALISARNQRHVRVRVITDDAKLSRPWVAHLRSAGIPVWTDSIGPRHDALMHNKFAVFDFKDSSPGNDWLWTGSFNVDAGAWNAENAIEVQDSGLAHAFTQEFEQMWGGTDSLPDSAHAVFHTGKKDVLSRHKFVVGSDTFRVYMGPQNYPVDTITALAAQAQSEIGFAIYSFTYAALAQAMRDRRNHGVWVGGSFDKSGATGQSNQYDSLLSWGFPVCIDTVLGAGNILHEKIMTIDQHITATGSVNWSSAGNHENDENSLIVNSRRITELYHNEIIRRFNESGGDYRHSGSAAAISRLARRKNVKDGGALACPSTRPTVPHLRPQRQQHL